MQLSDCILEIFDYFIDPLAQTFVFNFVYLPFFRIIEELGIARLRLDGLDDLHSSWRSCFKFGHAFFDLFHSNEI